jgi:hypothetical protein
MAGQDHTSFFARENIAGALLENIAIDDTLIHFQSSNSKTASVVSIPLRLVKPAPLYYTAMPYGIEITEVSVCVSR